MQILYAKDFGILPNTTQDLTAAFAQLLAAHPTHTTFVLEPGDYHFSSTQAIDADYYISNTDVVNPRQLSMLFKNMSHITLEGNGSRFLYSGQTIPLTADSCDHITFKNLTIDWTIPLSSEGLIVSSCEEWIDLRIDPEKYPYEVRDHYLYFKGCDWESGLGAQWGGPWGSLCEFDGVTKKVAYHSGDHFNTSKIEALEPGLVRFYGDYTGYRPKAGNYAVLRHNRRIHPGIFLHNSSHIHIENVAIHNTGGLGILAQFCDTLTFKAVRFESSKIAGRQFVSGHDDGLHLCNNMGQISVENCYFHGLMDDPMNVHGCSVRVIERIDAHTLKGLFVHHQAIGFDLWALAGHKISLINHEDMSSYGVVECTAFKLLSPTEFEISFGQPIPDDLNSGDALENLTRTPSLLCRNNYFGSCRARGVLISTPQPVRIENNVFESAGSAILVAGDANYWYESGACHDVIIQGNHFSDSCMTSMYQFCNGIISICPEIPKPNKDKPFHRNIKITDNTFHAFDYSVLYALSVDHLEFSRNRIIRSYTYTPFGSRKHMLNLEFCSHVVIADNQIIGDVLGQDIGLGQTSLSDISLSPTHAFPCHEEDVVIELM